MFYTREADSFLRFGDVIRGLPTVIPELDKDRMNSTTAVRFKLSVDTDTYCVVLTPCCSIDRGRINIAPMREILPSYLKNPYFDEDLTRINRTMTPEKAVPPEAWDRMSDDERARRLDQGESFAFLETIIYERHDLLPDYQLNTPGGKVTTSFYRVDFRESFGVNCRGLNRSVGLPPGVKILQLSIEARNDLREKMANYFSRIPTEDKSVLAI